MTKDYEYENVLYFHDLLGSRSAQIRTTRIEKFTHQHNVRAVCPKPNNLSRQLMYHMASPLTMQAEQPAGLFIGRVLLTRKRRHMHHLCIS